jgi:Tfp pilus assembly protein PilF
MAKVYIKEKKFLKAALHLTKAISCNERTIEYYKLRAWVYKIMGFQELSDEDEQIVKILEFEDNKK